MTTPIQSWLAIPPGSGTPGTDAENERLREENARLRAAVADLDARIQRAQALILRTEGALACASRREAVVRAQLVAEMTGGELVVRRAEGGAR